MVTGDIIRGESGPGALSSHFGCLLSGPASPLPHSHATSVLIIDGSTDGESPEHTDQLSQVLNQFWDSEAIGVVDQCKLTQDDFPPELTFDWRGGRYQVSLPWKSSIRLNLNCYSLCVGRLNQLYRRLKKKRSLLKEYDDVFNKQIKDGIIEGVTRQQENSYDKHFLPHHGVLREDKSTTKLRVVFDGSAKSNSKNLSLNDCLEKGPNVTPHIFDILLTF